MLLATMYEIKINGLDYLLKPLKERYRVGPRGVNS
jgi:uncharacterized protein (DUF3820 family)